jgi:hypothetical protein
MKSIWMIFAVAEITFQNQQKNKFAPTAPFEQP